MPDFDYTSHADEVLEALEKARANALTAIGLTAEAYAKKVLTAAKAVDTGRLRNSITFATKENEGEVKSFNYTVEVDGKKMKITDTTVIGAGAEEDSVYIGTNVEYAQGIETGTHRKAGAVNYLRRACTEHTDEYKKLARQAFENA